MHAGVRLFEAVLAQTGERVVLKEFLPVMRNLAASEIECVHHTRRRVCRLPSFICEYNPVQSNSIRA